MDTTETLTSQAGLDIKILEGYNEKCRIATHEYTERMQVLHAEFSKARKRTEARVKAKSLGANEAQMATLEQRMAWFEDAPDSTQIELGCDDCIMIHICGMWIGIEKDGYGHS